MNFFCFLFSIERTTFESSQQLCKARLKIVYVSSIVEQFSTCQIILSQCEIRWIVGDLKIECWKNLIILFVEKSKRSKAVYLRKFFRLVLPQIDFAWNTSNSHDVQSIFLLSKHSTIRIIIHLHMQQMFFVLRIIYIEMFRNSQTYHILTYTYVRMKNKTIFLKDCTWLVRACVHLTKNCIFTHSRNVPSMNDIK